MPQTFIEQRDGGYFIAGTRVSLYSVIYAYLRGESPEEIADSWPALTLEQVFGSLAFYLDQKELMDQYLRDGEREFEALRD